MLMEPKNMQHVAANVLSTVQGIIHHVMVDPRQPMTIYGRRRSLHIRNASEINPYTGLRHHGIAATPAIADMRAGEIAMSSIIQNRIAIDGNSKRNPIPA